MDWTAYVQELLSEAVYAIFKIAVACFLLGAASTAFAAFLFFGEWSLAKVCGCG